MGGLVGLVGLQYLWLPGPACAEAAGCWLVGLGHESAGCRTPGLVPALWFVEPGPKLWLQGPGVPELVSDCWWVGPVPDTAGCSV